MIPEGASFGPYRVLRRLGGGGAGEVFLAEPIPGKSAADGPARVALKVLDGRSDDPAAQQLLREVETAANLHNVHVIPYYGLVFDPSTAAVVMGYAPSGSLGDILRGERVSLPLPVGVVARIVMQVARALQTAHAAGLVHGDLKPNNIFVRTSTQGAPLAVVSDFGQAVLTRASVNLANSDSTTNEQAAWIARQLRFVAPEQLDGSPLPASDQYALAAVAYYLLTGRAPIVADTRLMPGAIANAVVSPPSQQNPALTLEADRVILRALAKQPNARFPSIADFAEALADTLAVSAARGAGGPGVTEQMSALTGSQIDSFAEAGTASRSGKRHAATNGEPVSVARMARALELDPVAGGALPDDASPRLRRALAIGVGVTICALLLTCVLSLFWSGGNLLPIPTTLGQGNPSTTAPTATDDGGSGTSSREAQAALQQLASVTSSSPIFSDSFSSNGAQWATSDVALIHDGHLYLANQSGKTAGLEKTPGVMRLNAVAVRADIALTQGTASDSAGICFFATSDTKGNPSYMCYLASADGRYELWSFRAQWSYITGGYSSALKLGIGQVNTLTVLANARQGDVTLFANGSYLARVPVGANPSLLASEGLLVLNVGAQASFTNYAVFDASQGA